MASKLTDEEKDLIKRKKENKKLTKSLIDMENQKFSTSRRIKAINEVLAIAKEGTNVKRRAVNLLEKLDAIR